MAMNGGVLAIDPGTKTGWGFWTGREALSGTWDFSPRRGDGAGVRFLRLRGRLDEMHRMNGPIGRLVYEMPGRFKSAAADDVVKGLVSHIQSWAESMNVPYEAVAPTELKKYATGKGAGKGTDKVAIFALAQERWPGISDHNEADARFLLQMVLDGRLE
jgi:hypothetical protein